MNEQAEPLFLWRSWRVRGGRLAAQHVYDIANPWETNVFAEAGHEWCSKIYGRQHDAPTKDSPCGLYGVYHPRDVFTLYSVWGVMMCWGEIQLHAEGARVQYAQILALARGAKISQSDLFYFRRSSRYECPLVTKGGFNAYGIPSWRSVLREVRKFHGQEIYSMVRGQMKNGYRGV